VVKWMHLSGGTRKGTKRKRAGPKVNFKERPKEGNGGGHCSSPIFLGNDVPGKDRRGQSLI
ncbi:aminopeptidase O isoform X1, partial [Tachysurus ichikawai]